MVSVQMLSELEEVVWYKINPERGDVIKQIWWDRLQVRTASEWMVVHSCVCVCARSLLFLLMACLLYCVVM